jgi:GNAT superfamily N-acetyltransferase
MPCTVRPATAADAETVIEFNRLLAWETEGKALDPAELSAGVRAVLADPIKGLYYLAEGEGGVAGQICLTYEFSDWRNGWMWWIQSVYVRPEFRRLGVFRALYEHVEAAARADPTVIGLRLYVENGNKAAQETYYRLGMQPAGYLMLEKYPLRAT